MSKLISELTINEVLPHAEPMILLDRYLHSGEDYACCEVSITPDSLFYDAVQDAVPAYVGIEYMAQTIAAFSGAQERRHGHQAKIGFLLGTRKYAPSVLWFKREERLKVSAVQVLRDSTGLCVFECRIENDAGILYAEAKLNVFQPEQAAQWVKENS